MSLSMQPISAVPARSQYVPLHHASAYAQLMRSGALRRVGLSVALPLIFGVVFAAAKGEGAGVREAVGNLSAPWLLLAFGVGLLWDRLWIAPIAGFAGTWIGLGSFYATESVLFHLGGHSWATPRCRPYWSSGEWLNGKEQKCRQRPQWPVASDGTAESVVTGLAFGRRPAALPVGVGR